MKPSVNNQFVSKISRITIRRLFSLNERLYISNNNVSIQCITPKLFSTNKCLVSVSINNVAYRNLVLTSFQYSNNQSYSLIMYKPTKGDSFPIGLLNLSSQKLFLDCRIIFLKEKIQTIILRQIANCLL